MGIFTLHFSWDMFFMWPFSSIYCHWPAIISYIAANTYDWCVLVYSNQYLITWLTWIHQYYFKISFTMTDKGLNSISKFCHTLKNVADNLKDVESPITKIEFLMQILRQLSPSYHNIVDMIINTKSFVSFWMPKYYSMA